MRKNIQNYKLVAEYAPIHIVFTDIKGTILYANKAVEDITGFKNKEIIGNNPRLWGRQMSESFYKKFWRTIKYEKKLFEGEITNKRKNGELYTAFARVSPVLEKEKLIGFIGIERDITKEKEVDMAKTEFVSFASHQLKNPLSVVNLYVQLLLGGKTGRLNSKQKEYLQKIKNSNKQMLSLINSMLDVSKMELGRFINEPKTVKLNKILKNVIREFNPIIKKKQINLKQNYADNIPDIFIDPKLLTIVLQNLLSNAVKYTPDKGKITIEASAHKNSFRLAVTDSGCGIPKDEQGRVFTKLFRASNTNRSLEGTGLGLYMAKTIIEKIKGRIWFESPASRDLRQASRGGVKNKGTAFYIELPIKSPNRIDRQ